MVIFIPVDDDNFDNSNWFLCGGKEYLMQQIVFSWNCDWQGIFFSEKKNKQTNRRKTETPILNDISMLSSEDSMFVHSKTPIPSVTY